MVGQQHFTDNSFFMVALLMKFSIGHKSPIPLHIRAKNLLSKLIQLPQYPNGNLLPGEAELAKQLAMSKKYASPGNQQIGELY
jgi:hypothetical protein